jgi:hypothetical protein
MKKPRTDRAFMITGVKVAWVALYLAVVAYDIVENRGVRGEAQVITLYMLMALTFPSGLIFYNGVIVLMSLADLPDAILDVTLYLGLAIVGYLQWFKLIPLITTKVRIKMSARIKN